jgi:hypothetical protein
MTNIAFQLSPPEGCYSGTRYVGYTGPLFAISYKNVGTSDIPAGHVMRYDVIDRNKSVLFSHAVQRNSPLTVNQTYILNVDIGDSIPQTWADGSPLSLRARLAVSMDDHDKGNFLCDYICNDILNVLPSAPSADIVDWGVDGYNKSASVPKGTQLSAKLKFKNTSNSAFTYRAKLEIRYPDGTIATLVNDVSNVPAGQTVETAINFALNTEGVYDIKWSVCEYKSPDFPVLSTTGWKDDVLTITSVGAQIIDWWVNDGKSLVLNKGESVTAKVKWKTTGNQTSDYTVVFTLRDPNGTDTVLTTGYYSVPPNTTTTSSKTFSSSYLQTLGYYDMRFEIFKGVPPSGNALADTGWLNDVILVVPPPAIVQGYVRVGSLGVDGVTVILWRGSVKYSTTTVMGGYYVFNNVTPGSYEVIARWDGYNPDGRSFVVSAGQTVNIDLSISAAPSGTGNFVLQAYYGGNPLSGTARAFGPTYATCTLSGGGCSFFNMRKGTYIILVDGRWSAITEFTTSGEWLYVYPPPV